MRHVLMRGPGVEDTGTDGLCDGDCVLTVRLASCKHYR